MAREFSKELEDVQGVYLRIEVNQKDNWVYLDWRGFQNEHRTREGMTYYLKVMKTFNLQKILSDNRNQEGPYPKNIDSWIAHEWLPKAIEAGFRAGATILSPEIFTKMSAENLVKNVGGVTYRNFKDENEAIKWLRKQ